MLLQLWLVVACIVSAFAQQAGENNITLRPTSPNSEFGAFVGGQFFATRGVQSLPPARSRLPPISTTVPLNGLAKWVHSGFLEPLGEGVFASGTVTRMVRNESSVVVVGSFQWTRCEPRSCAGPGHDGFVDRRVLRNIAVFNFDRSVWSGIGLGCAGYVNDVVVYGSNIIVAGALTDCFNDGDSLPSEVLVTNVGSWDPVRGWFDLGSSAMNALVVSSITRHEQTGNLFAVASSTPASGGDQYVYLKRYDFQQRRWETWYNSPLPDQYLVVRCFGSSVYIGGVFSGFGDTLANNIVRVGVDKMFPVDSLNGGVVGGPVYDIAAYKDGVLAGGAFTYVYPTLAQVNNLAYYSNGKWGPLGEFHAVSNAEWQVWSIDTLSDGAVVAAGYFDSVGNGTKVNNVAVFNETTSTWHQIGDPGSDAPLAPYTLFATVFAGMHQVVSFGYSGSSDDSVLASFLEPVGWAFEPQALMETGTVNCAAVSPSSGLVAVGGLFSSNGGNVVRSLALWNHTNLTTIGSGVFGEIRGVAFYGSSLAVVGSFSLVEKPSTPAIFGFVDVDSGNWTLPAIPDSDTFQSFAPFRAIHVVDWMAFIGGEFYFRKMNSSGVVGFSFQTMQFVNVGTPGSSWEPGSVVLTVTDNTTHLFVGGTFMLHVPGLGKFFNFACLDLLHDAWVDITRACDETYDCAAEAIHSISVSGGSVFVGGNFTYIGSGGIRVPVNNVAQLGRDGTWSALFQGQPGYVVMSVAAVNSTVVNTTTVIAAGKGTKPGEGFLQVYSGGQWQDLDNSWKFRVFDVRVVLVFYYAKQLIPPEWPVYGMVLAAFMGVFVLCGLIVVVWFMRKRGTTAKEYSLLDVSQQEGEDDDAWLIDYDSLHIQNPPIGKGSYSVVNRAVLKGTVVAVKTYVGQDYYGDLRADFNREIALLTRLRHPNIILFIGACRSPLCIVTELAERGCLYDVIHQTPQEMTWTRIRSIALDSCRGLAYLHNQTPPILHRDLKSANVLISDNFVAKISDFGIAKRLAVHTMTQRVGTTRWMAPEVLATKASTTAYSLGSDVYSFGVIVHEMISLELPWGDVHFDHQIEDRVLSGETLRIPNGTPSVYAELMLDCWKFDSQQRPMFTAIIQRLEAIPMIEGSPERRK